MLQYSRHIQDKIDRPDCVQSYPPLQILNLIFRRKKIVIMLCFSKQDIMFAYIKIMLSEKWKLPGVRTDISEIRRFFILQLEKCIF